MVIRNWAVVPGRIKAVRCVSVFVGGGHFLFGFGAVLLVVGVVLTDCPLILYPGKVVRPEEAHRDGPVAGGLGIGGDPRVFRVQNLSWPPVGQRG
jgi:hypothetical protein